MSAVGLGRPRMSARKQVREQARLRAFHFFSSFCYSLHLFCANMSFFVNIFGSSCCSAFRMFIICFAREAAGAERKVCVSGGGGRGGTVLEKLKAKSRWRVLVDTPSASTHLFKSRSRTSTLKVESSFNFAPFLFRPHLIISFERYRWRISAFFHYSSKTSLSHYDLFFLLCRPNLI